MIKLIPKSQKGQIVPKLISSTLTGVPATIKNIFKLTESTPLPFTGGLLTPKITPKIKGLDSRVKEEDLRNMFAEVNSDRRLNKYQKAVILAHMGVESFFNPFQQQVGGPAYGPMQFEADRQQEFKKYVNKYGTNFRSAVDYLVNTMILKPDTNKHWRYFGDKYPKAMDSYNTFKNAKDLNSALEASYYGYVRPKSSQNADSAKVELLKRLDLAQQFLKYLD